MEVKVENGSDGERDREGEIESDDSSESSDDEEQYDEDTGNQVNVEGREKLVKCTECPRMYKSRKSMWQHKSKDHKGFRFKCDQCESVFKTAFALKRHSERVHINPKPLKEFSKLSRPQQIRRMNRICENETNMPEYKKNCLCILEGIESNKERLKHFKVFHMGYEQCSKCNKIIEDENVQDHKCGKVRIKKPKYTPQGPFICDECGTQFNTISMFDYHIKTRHLTDMRTCHICSKAFPKPNLRKHILTHKSKTACNICGKLVARMKLHMETVHVDDSLMPERCELCNKGFASAQKLADHNMSVHLKLRPYKCR